MKDNRPVNLDIASMRLPLTAWVSIAHRISGVFLFLASLLMLWALDASLSGPEGFARVAAAFGSMPARLVVWLVGSALIYHTLAGVKHLFMDFGRGETMPGGVAASWVVIVSFVAGSVALGVALW